MTISSLLRDFSLHTWGEWDFPGNIFGGDQLNHFRHGSAAMALFLATTDAVRSGQCYIESHLIRLLQTIVSTILPTITTQLSASSSQYTWVSVTYMLTQTAFQPLYGKVSDLIGRMVGAAVIRCT